MMSDRREERRNPDANPSRQENAKRYTRAGNTFTT